jgi:5-histidylcysteine sulfoxide synthase
MSKYNNTGYLQLNSCHHSNDFRSKLLDYFEGAWNLDDIIMKSIIGQATFYLNPDPLRNRLIFYLGHTAVFYINKLIQVGLMKARINPTYETLFEIGVDPETPAELATAIKDIDWPEVDQVWQYRETAKAEITAVINTMPLNLPIHQHHPCWALLMAIEHSRVHFETSSMLLRQLPIERLKRPPEWNYAPSNGDIPQNEMQEISGGVVKLGKPADDLTFGWDIEYGHLEVAVKPFLASQYLITNGEFLEFVRSSGYQNRDYWHPEAWQWKQLYNIQYPKFWISSPNNYRYRATFDEIDLPLNWPVEVNHYEAIAFCKWKGSEIRLMSEAEWNQALTISEDRALLSNSNLNLQFFSPSPVGLFKPTNPSGISDLRGNVWEWLADTLKPLPKFAPHPLYPDHAAPFFDNKHPVMLGGSWATNGSMALPSYRNWFRPYFYQHVGFRIAQNLPII